MDASLQRKRAWPRLPANPRENLHLEGLTFIIVLRMSGLLEFNLLAYLLNKLDHIDRGVLRRVNPLIRDALAPESLFRVLRIIPRELAPFKHLSQTSLSTPGRHCRELRIFFGAAPLNERVFPVSGAPSHPRQSSDRIVSNWNRVLSCLQALETVTICTKAPKDNNTLEYDNESVFVNILMRPFCDNFEQATFLQHLTTLRLAPMHVIHITNLCGLSSAYETHWTTGKIWDQITDLECQFYIQEEHGTYDIPWISTLRVLQRWLRGFTSNVKTLKFHWIGGEDGRRPHPLALEKWLPQPEASKERSLFWLALTTIFTGNVEYGQLDLRSLLNQRVPNARSYFHYKFLTAIPFLHFPTEDGDPEEWDRMNWSEDRGWVLPVIEGPQAMQPPRQQARTYSNASTYDSSKKSPILYRESDSRASSGFSQGIDLGSPTSQYSTESKPRALAETSGRPDTNPRFNQHRRFESISPEPMGDEPQLEQLRTSNTHSPSALDIAVVNYRPQRQLGSTSDDTMSRQIYQAYPPSERFVSQNGLMRSSNITRTQTNPESRHRPSMETVFETKEAGCSLEERQIQHGYEQGVYITKLSLTGYEDCVQHPWSPGEQSQAESFNLSDPKEEDHGRSLPTFMTASSSYPLVGKEEQLRNQFDVEPPLSTSPTQTQFSAPLPSSPFVPLERVRESRPRGGSDSKAPGSIHGEGQLKLVETLTPEELRAQWRSKTLGQGNTMSSSQYPDSATRLALSSKSFFADSRVNVVSPSWSRKSSIFERMTKKKGPKSMIADGGKGKSSSSIGEDGGDGDGKGEKKRGLAWLRR